MSLPTPSSRDSSTPSAAPIVLRPERSRLLRVWRIGVHGLAAAGILASGLPAALKLTGLGILLVHGLLCRPMPPETLRRAGDGTWALPERCLEQLVLREGTTLGPFWILLRLGGAGPRAVSVLLLRDQLGPETWRALQAELRRARPHDAERA